MASQIREGEPEQVRLAALPWSEASPILEQTLRALNGNRTRLTYPVAGVH